MKKKDLEKQIEEIEEMIEMFHKLDYGDKREVKGILIGLTLKRDPEAVVA